MKKIQKRQQEVEPAIYYGKSESISAIVSQKSSVGMAFLLTKFVTIFTVKKVS